jgi:hypothetical protein
VRSAGEPGKKIAGSDEGNARRRIERHLDKLVTGAGGSDLSSRDRAEVVRRAGDKVLAQWTSKERPDSIESYLALPEVR